MIKIAIDFDGVICNLKGIKRPHNFSNCKPKKDAQEALDWLEENKYNFYIFTSRPKKEWGLIRNWLYKNSFKQQIITNIKKDATIYLDDRAIRFTNWVDFCKLLG